VGGEKEKGKSIEKLSSGKLNALRVSVTTMTKPMTTPPPKSIMMTVKQPMIPMIPPTPPPLLHCLPGWHAESQAAVQHP
jgi:hypothetical protein